MEVSATECLLRDKLLFYQQTNRDIVRQGVWDSLRGGVKVTGSRGGTDPESRGRGAAWAFPEQVADASRCCRDAAKRIMSRLHYLRDADYSGASSSGSAPGGFCRDQLFSLSSCRTQLSLTCSRPVWMLGHRHIHRLHRQRHRAVWGQTHLVYG